MRFNRLRFSSKHSSPPFIAATFLATVLLSCALLYSALCSASFSTFRAPPLGSLAPKQSTQQPRLEGPDVEGWDAAIDSGIATLRTIESADRRNGRELIVAGREATGYFDAASARARNSERVSVAEGGEKGPLAVDERKSAGDSSVGGELNDGKLAAVDGENSPGRLRSSGDIRRGGPLGIATDENAETFSRGSDAELRRSDGTRHSADATGIVPLSIGSVSSTFKEKLHRNVFYLKTHKSGSSAVAKALLRYCDRMRLSHTLRLPTTTYVVGGNLGSNRIDCFVTHHAAYDAEMLATYLKGRPDFVLTSLRLPMQRQLSWFRQQNKDWDARLGNVTSTECGSATSDALLTHFDDWIGRKRSASQWYTLQERGARLGSGRLKGNASAILEQFDFVFLKERMVESMECMCVEHGVRLCDREHPLRPVNTKAPNSCVENKLLVHRAEALMAGSVLDTILYERVDRQITACQRRGIPAVCRCVQQN